MIVTARYNTIDQVSITTVSDDDKRLNLPSYPSHTHYDTQMDEFINEGGVIEPYEPYYEWPLERAVNIKNKESEDYAQILITEAYSEPTVGTVVNSVIHLRRTESRRKNRADKQAGEIVLTEEEKNEAKTDQKLAEYEIKCWTASDKVIGNIAKETTVEVVMAIDIPTNTAWPIWEPPV